MKPFLGIDLTENKKNEKVNGSEFLVAVPSSATARSLERSSNQAKETIKRSQLPLPLNIAQWVCGTLGVIVIAGVLNAVVGNDGISVSQAYKNAPELFWLGGVCLLIWGILKIMSRRKEKTVLESDESDRVLTKFHGSCDAIHAELAVPDDATEVDVLAFLYKRKGEKIKVCERGMQIAPYMNLVFNIFADEENFYLANLEGKYAFPLSSLVAIHTVKKHICILGWNKDGALNKRPYKQYKLTIDNFGRVHAKYYHVLEINHNGRTWGIYIPNYELPVFEKITGLKAE